MPEMEELLVKYARAARERTETAAAIEATVADTVRKQFYVPQDAFEMLPGSVRVELHDGSYPYRLVKDIPGGATAYYPVDGEVRCAAPTREEIKEAA